MNYASWPVTVMTIQSMNPLNFLNRDKHIWRFFRAGGFDQVKLESVDDLESLGELDQKLWATLSCPTSGLEFDERTLQLIDIDKDGRIRVPEILKAVKWACRNLKKPEDLFQGGRDLPLAAIDDTEDEGKRLLASAREVLTSLGKGKSETISVADTMDTAKIFAQMKFNGDGIVPAAEVDDPDLKTMITDVINTCGGEVDRNGSIGVGLKKLTEFYLELQAYSDWWAVAEASLKEILPLGADMAPAFAAFMAVRMKIDDYFTRCKMASFDSRAGILMNRTDADFLLLASKELSAGAADVANFPISRVEVNKPLALQEGVNPAWAGALIQFQRLVVHPMLFSGKNDLSWEEWTQLCFLFKPYEAWLAIKKGALVEKLTLNRVRLLLKSPLKETLMTLIAKDKAFEPEATYIEAVERLARYYRDLGSLLNNYVAFSDFYSGKRKAVFQSGTLYLDGRSCELCVWVSDITQHSTLATLSKTYLAYCECSSKCSSQKRMIAAAFTGGDSDHLMVGRNGVFYDRLGRDWDATIVKIIEHPISIKQSILAPYKRIGRMINEQIERMAAERDQAVTAQAAAQIGQIGEVAKKAEVAKAVPKTPFDVARFAGIFAAFGLALGALGTAAASVFQALVSLAWWQRPLAILGVLVLISGPSVILAWLKLRQRNLGPMLDASGWAINGRARINIPFGEALTATAKLPANSIRSLEDPFAEKKSPLRWVVILLIITVISGYIAYKCMYPKKSNSEIQTSTNSVNKVELIVPVPGHTN